MGFNKNVIGGEKLQGDARVHLAKSATMYTGASYAGVKILENVKKWSKDATAAMSSLKTDPMKLQVLKMILSQGYTLCRSCQIYHHHGFKHLQN